MAAFGAQAQTTVKANKIIAKDSLHLSGKTVGEIFENSNFSTATHKDMPTALAVKNFFEANAIDSVSIVSDSILVLYADGSEIARDTLPHGITVAEIAAIISDSLATIPGTDLSFVGMGSPATLESSTGDDVQFLAGAGISFNVSGGNLTITNTNSVSNLSYDAANHEVDVSGGGTSATIPLAVDDGATEGLASFTAADFNVTSGNVGLDYTNGQAASGSLKGFLSATDWTTFNSKIGGSGAAGQVGYFSGSATLTGSNNLFWDNTNIRLGIGTNAPTYPIHILGNAASGYGLYVRNQNATSGNIFAGIYLENNTSGTHGIIFKANSGYTTYRNISANDFGIYNSTASGNMSFLNDNATGNINFLTGATGATAQVIIASTTNRFNIKGLGATSSTNTFLAENSSGTDLLTIRDDGAVAVMNSSFAARLSVTGSGATSATNSFLAENSSGTDVLVVRDDGNIGIGTSSPLTQLHVNSATNTSSPLFYLSNLTTGSNVQIGFNMDTGANYGSTNNRGTGFNQFNKNYSASNWNGSYVAGNSLWYYSAADTINNFMTMAMTVPGSNVASYRGGFRWNITHDPTVFTTSNELMRLNKVGLGLGTSNASAKLHVVGDFKLTSRIGTATALAGWDLNNKSTDVTKGNGLTLTSGTLDVNRDSFPNWNDLKNIYETDATITTNRTATIKEDSFLLFQSTNSESGLPYRHYVGTVLDDLDSGDYVFGRYSLTGDLDNYLMNFEGYSYDEGSIIKRLSAYDGSSSSSLNYSASSFQVLVNTVGGLCEIRATDAGIVILEGENGIEFKDGPVTNMMTLNTDAARLESSLILVNDAADLTEDGQIWKEENRLNFNTANLSTSLSGVMFTGTADATVANTTTETTLISSGDGTVTIPANYLKVGKTITVEAWGIYTADASPSTLEIKASLGGVLLCTTGANTMTTTEGGQWHATITFTCRTTGASGTVMSQGEARFSHAVDAYTMYWMRRSTTNTVNTASALAFNLTGQHGAADPDNSITLTNIKLIVEN